MTNIDSEIVKPYESMALAEVKAEPIAAFTERLRSRNHEATIDCRTGEDFTPIVTAAVAVLQVEEEFHVLRYGDDPLCSSGQPYVEPEVAEDAASATA